MTRTVVVPTRLRPLLSPEETISATPLWLDQPVVIRRLRKLTVRDSTLAGPLFLDFSDLTSPCELRLERLGGAPANPTAGPSPGARAEPSIVILCPQSRRSLLDVTAEDLDLAALTVRELRAPEPADRDRYALGRVEIHRSTIGAIEAARISCTDIELRGLACEGRLILSEANIQGALHLEHARVGDKLKLPGRARHVCVRRCELRGGVYASGGEIDGPIALERIETKSSPSVSFNGLTAHGGISILDSKINGSVTLSHCRTPSVSLEDTTVKGATTLAVACPKRRPISVDEGHECLLLAKNARSLRDTEPFESLVVVSATRGRFKGSFTVRWADRSRASTSRPDGRRLAGASEPGSRQPSRTSPDAHRQRDANEGGQPSLYCGCQPRGIALWALAATFEGPTQCIVAGPNLVAESRFLETTDFELTGGERTTLDLTDVLAGSATVTVTGTGGSERVTYVDGCTAETLRLERVDLRQCRFAQIRVQQLRLGSDVALYKREPRELIETRPVLGRIWTYFNWIFRFFVHVSPHKVLDERDPEHADGIPVNGRQIPGVSWTSPWLRRAPTSRPRAEPAPHRPVCRRIRDWFGKFAARQHHDVSLEQIRQAQDLARIYRMLSGAFDGQGDATLAGDFTWQHAQWRRRYLGRLTQFENRRGSGDEAAQPNASLEKPTDESLNSFVRARRFLFRSPFGGVTFGWIVMRGHEIFGGSGVRARTPLAWLAVATAVLFLATEWAQNRNPLCGQFNTRVTAVATSADLPAPNPTDVNPPADGRDFSAMFEEGFSPPPPATTSEVCLALRNASTTALTVKAIMPLASIDPVASRSDSSLTLLFVVGHVIGAFLIGLFAIAVAHKARIRRYAGG